MPTLDPKTYLWENVVTLMGGGSPSLDEIAARTKAGRGSIQRIKERNASPRVETLELIAKAFDIEVWQLLVPGLQYAQRGDYSERAHDLARLYDNLPEELQKVLTGTAEAFSSAKGTPVTLEAYSTGAPASAPTPQPDKAP